MKPAAFHPLGVHLLADLHGIDAHHLIDAAAIDRLLLQSAAAAGAQVLFSHFHSFGTDQGVTGVVLLAESHISIHTWPESGFVAADIFMCGNADPQQALKVMQQAWKPVSCTVQTITRGGTDDLRRRA